MAKRFSRRDFFKLGGLTLASAALPASWWSGAAAAPGPDFPRQPEQPEGRLARITSKQVDVRSRPDDEAPIVGNRFRDQLVHVYEELIPPDAPKYYNPLWYRVWGGYIHCAHTQIVQTHLNEPERYLQPGGQLCEVTVPYTTAYQYTKWDGWAPWRGSRLYYSSTHWATAIEAGPDRQPWYQITNELSDSEIYYVPAMHLRYIAPEEWSPISLDVPPDKKRIEVSLSEQTVRAFEYDQAIFTARISSGIPNSRLAPEDLPTATPVGKFVIYSKMPSKHMGSVAGGTEVEAQGGFTLPGVPWTSFFRSPGGYALHGTYWHNNFGLQMSHGCVNMRNEDARWLFRWTSPVFDSYKIESSKDWEKTGHGTTVLVYK